MAKPAKIKTTQTDESVDAFIRRLPKEQQQTDSRTLVSLMEQATKEKPKMWGPSMIGFGKKRYKSPTSGREVDWFIIGFAPRKTNVSLYLNISLQQHADDLKQLGKHKTGVGCIYINHLSDINVNVLE